MRKSRTGFIAGTTMLLIILLGLAVMMMVWVMAKDQFNTERVIFQMDDPKGDDYGPGGYVYPNDSIFDPKKEHFDLHRFSFSALRNNYYFDMEFPRITNPWGAPEGYSQTMIQIYLADDTGNGRIEPFKEGANVIFDPQNPWKYLIKVVSFNKTSVFWTSDYEGAGGRNKGVVAEVPPGKQAIQVKVPKSLLPGDPYKWRFYVLVGSQDGMGPDNFRPVKAVVGQWYLGGGTDTEYNPNIIDLLAPYGEQERMLGSYNVSERVQAIVEPVGPSTVVPGQGEIVLDKVIEIVQKYKIKI